MWDAGLVARGGWAGLMPVTFVVGRRLRWECVIARSRVGANDMPSVVGYQKIKLLGTTGLFASLRAVAQKSATAIGFLAHLPGLGALGN